MARGLNGPVARRARSVYAAAAPERSDRHPLVPAAIEAAAKTAEPSPGEGRHKTIFPSEAWKYGGPGRI